MRSRCYSRVRIHCIVLGSLYLIVLLLAYQSEIDTLTKRSKASENAFLHVYKVLAEAPDPYPLLEAAVVRPALTHTGADALTVTYLGPNCQGCRSS